jgi:hypothetical protein
MQGGDMKDHTPASGFHSNAPQAEEGRARSRISRRQVLGAGATLAGLALVSPSLTSETLGAGEDVLIGVVERVESPSTLLVTSSGNPAVIKLADAAVLSHGPSGLVAGLGAFIPREEVVAEGQWIDGAFIATALMTRYRLVEGTIVRRHGNRLETTAGDVLLAPYTVPESAPDFTAKPLNHLRVGDTIWADGWHDPTISNFVALRIGVRSAL